VATPIKVVLQEDVDKLGASGDVVRVRPGFARNYLIPRGLAAQASQSNLARVEELKRRAAMRAEQELAGAKELAKKLEAVRIKIERAVGEENKMYGSVTSRDLEEAFQALGVEIDRKKLDLPEPIRKLGLSEVPIRLARGITATLKVEVIKKSS
jgi:large subunit ribosomal protein L9